ncbi:hypothetical protein [Paenibacillus sp. SAFN-117]
MQISKTETAIRLDFSFQMTRLESLRERQLGKTVLYTPSITSKKLSNK